MATIKKYNNSTWENTTARKYETKSEIITPPTTIYADGSNITTYTIKGNTVQNGTPTPSVPIAVQGVGELDSGQYKIPISNGQTTTPIYLGSTQTTRQIKKIVLTGDESGWVMSGTGLFYNLYLSDNPRERDVVMSTHFAATHEGTLPVGTFRFGGSIESPTNPLVFNYDNGSIGLEAFKSWIASQYANGTPVEVYYILENETTAAVNEPLMKIGTYADTLSNAASIPTTDGANTITVDTTVQPSEFTATWTGWHNASVKEWDGSQWS